MNNIIKMKTYILILARIFPKGHPDAGQVTRFITSLSQGSKIHTIRGNYADWEKKVQDVLRGDARISIRIWKGKPYRSRQVELLSLDKDSGVGVQKLRSFDDENAYFISDKGNVFPVSLQKMANNDGLSVNEWKGWFKDNSQCPLAIIHFTDFRYRL